MIGSAHGRDVIEETLPPRDAEVVRAIEEEGLSVFSFDGLRRITGAHPETLSRILERLREQGVVARGPEGYLLTDKGKDAVAVRPLGSAETRIPLLQTRLPIDVDLPRIVSSLKGKWFGDLRWVGYSVAEEGSTLKWVTDDGSVQISARFTPGELDIDAKVGAGKDMSHAIKVAHLLLGQVSRMYSARRGGIMQMGVPLGYLSTASM
jgi:hypothetical protein